MVICGTLAYRRGLSIGNICFDRYIDGKMNKGQAYRRKVIDS